MLGMYIVEYLTQVKNFFYLSKVLLNKALEVIWWLKHSISGGHLDTKSGIVKL